MYEVKQNKPKTGRQPRSDRKHRSRIWLWVLGGIAVLILLVVLLAPVLLSSRGFTRWVQAKISRSTGGQTRIGDLSVGWLKGVRVADFSFRGENNWTQVEIGRITAHPSYGSLFSGMLALNRTVIDQPQVAFDMRERPPSKGGPPFDVNQIERLGDVVVRDASIRVTNTAGETAQVADLNSELHIRPRGQTSRFQASMVVPITSLGPEGTAQEPGRVAVNGEATPNKKTGWSLRGTTGNVTMEVNDLNLASVAPFLELAGVQVEARGQVSGNITGAIQDGQVENLNATIVGRDVDITGEALQGDRLQTSSLNVRATLAQSQEVINLSQLDIRTDWAQVSATGTLPKTPGSLSSLLESGKAYDVKGQFDMNLAAILSQMPNTLGVRAGTEITAGRATGNISTTTEGGRAVLVAKAEITDLAGVANNQPVKLGGPVQTTLRLSTGEQGALLEGLNVIAPFARLTASGNFEQINYQGQADLASLQSNLGPFINLGQYSLAGQIASQGQVSIGDKVTGLAGTLSGQKLVLAAPDGNSVTEPQLTANFQLALNRQEQALAINNLTAHASFGTVSVQNTMVPMGQKSQAPLRLVIQGRDINLGRLEPYAALIGAPLPVTLQGTAQSQVAVTSQAGVYHIVSDATRIENFQVTSPGNPPFQQPEVTASFEVYADSHQKRIDRASWAVESPQIKLKGQLTQTGQGNALQAQGALDGQFDWAAVAPLMSGFLPGQLSVAGQRQVSLNFTSTYPADQPNGFLAHLNSQASLGFDRADYVGFNFGPTEIDVRVENGLLGIRPISATVNNGTLNLIGTADLRQRPIVLRTPAPVHMVQNVQINQQTTDQLLKYANPIFANVIRASGIANLDVEAMAIPLTSNIKNEAELTGTLSLSQVSLGGASTLLGQILGVTGQSMRGQLLTVHPTRFVLQKGVVRYDDMQIDVGDLPINFRGAIGLNKALDMTVVLPYTIEGRTARVGRPDTGQRIAVPLTGTLDKPQLNLQKLPQSLLEGQLQKGLEELFKKR